MEPARFVTLCFLYSGAILFGSWILNYQFQLDLASLVQLVAALAIFGTGALRLRRPDIGEQTPSTYGPFTYGMAILSLLLTVLFVARILLI